MPCNDEESDYIFYKTSHTEAALPFISQLSFSGAQRDSTTSVLPMSLGQLAKF